ncbi:MAG: cation-translocating P-type ATPase [Deltaproteobacteria bacterium]|nr:cation-translocating P-type ATPase [Deltaproteobacteria bacterium]
MEFTENMKWHAKTADETIKDLGADSINGLSSAEAAGRLEKYGPNILAGKKQQSRLLKFLGQFTEFIVIILIAAAAIAGALGEWVDAGAIMAIVILNGIIGFAQEEKAERVIENLKKLSSPTAKAVRDKAASIIPAERLVPGDILLLEAGDICPADCRVIESISFKIDESALTGESHAVDKETAALSEDTPVADRINMVFLGTKAASGRARAVVTATGMATEMGAIAKMIEAVKPEPTPLQKRLSGFARSLVWAAIAICAVIFFIGILRGERVVVMFLTAVSLAVAAVPEGLPAVVTITLALGVQRMVKRHALIRKLPSVETLGSATVIATDKTGTITKNQMTVKKVYLAGSGAAVDVGGSGYAPEGRFYIGSNELRANDDPALMLLIKAGLLCGTAELKRDENNGLACIGDPTEGALITLAMKAGLTKSGLADELVISGEMPFDSATKMMSTVYKNSSGNRFYAFVKGAPEKIIALSGRVFTAGGGRAMSDDDRKIILQAGDAMAADAMRTLAFACIESDAPIDPAGLCLPGADMVFVGLAGMIDPAREEARASVETARRAGITPVMITGDHKLTALAIAKQAGIFIEGDMAVAGDELDKMSEDEFSRQLPRIKVYARVNPEHKLRIIKAWKNRGETIAMTGDGVNDAPALKEADIGVAMGVTGTDVAKEASDMVLTDDNFASIVAAVEEGRGIFSNIRKVVHFLISCNIGEILTLLIASIAGMPLPLLPVQILWMNLVTDGLPAIGLAMEPAQAGIMNRPPREKTEGIVTRKLFWIMLLQGAFMAFCTLAAYAVYLYYFHEEAARARTVAFMVLVLCQKFHIFNCRDMERSAFRLGLFSNRMLNAAVGFIIVSQILIVYLPGLQLVFKVSPLRPLDWLIVIAFSIQPLVWMEAVKRRRGKG